MTRETRAEWLRGVGFKDARTAVREVAERAGYTLLDVSRKKKRKIVVEEIVRFRTGRTRSMSSWYGQILTVEVGRRSVGTHILLRSEVAFGRMNKHWEEAFNSDPRMNLRAAGGHVEGIRVMDRFLKKLIAHLPSTWDKPGEPDPKYEVAHWKQAKGEGMTLHRTGWY